MERYGLPATSIDEALVSLLVEQVVAGSVQEDDAHLAFRAARQRMAHLLAQGDFEEVGPDVSFSEPLDGDLVEEMVTILFQEGRVDAFAVQA